MSLNIPVPTGYSGFWQTQGDKQPYSMQIAAGQHRAKGAWLTAKLFNKYGTRDAAAALAVLIGAVAGTTATNGFTSTPNPPGPSATVPTVTGLTDLGGLRTAVTTASYNRTTSTPDVNELKRCSLVHCSKKASHIQHARSRWWWHDPWWARRAS